MYKKVVLCLVYNQSQILLQLRNLNADIVHPGTWGFFSGTIDINENPKNAVKRELNEETGIQNIKILNEIDGWFEYELPNYLLGKIWRGKFRGQKQKWFIVKFLGNDEEINLEKDKPEFIEWKWLDIENLPNVIVDFKKKVYEKLLPKIRNFIN